MTFNAEKFVKERYPHLGNNPEWRKENLEPVARAAYDQGRKERHMNASESFEMAAAAFQNVSGHLAPGKDGCTRSKECLHDWNIWCAAVEYLKRFGSRAEAEGRDA